MATGLEVAEVFRRHGETYRQVHAEHLGRTERRVMGAIAACRTAALGGHAEYCEDCGLVRCAYSSCRNRHCPKCQGLARAEWLADRQAELLPVPYFHVVFTMPAQIAAIAFQNKPTVYAILFRAAAETLRTIAADPRHLGAEIGLVAVLHSWGPDPAAPSSHSLPGPRRRSVQRWHALDRLPARLLSPGAGALPAFPTTVPGAAPGLIQRSFLLWRACSTRRPGGLQPYLGRAPAPRLGRLYQTSLRRPRAGAVLPWPPQGEAQIISGRRRKVRLEEVPVERRGPIIKEYIRLAPGARPHIGLSTTATIADCQRVAPNYPVFRIVFDPNGQEDH